jgi:hypothetical protein
MGWKASTIIIHEPTAVDHEALLKKIGLVDLKKISNEPFEVALNPTGNKVYIGTYKNNLLICIEDLPMHFFEKKESTIEKKLYEIFPNSELCAIVLHSGVNLWGYSISKKGSKIRVKAGSADDGTFVEIGDPIKEEQALLSKSTVSSNGQRTYLLDEDDDEPLTEDQVGENFVFAISKRYFGVELDHAEDLLYETSLTGYTYQISNKKSKKWLPYLLLFVVLCIWQILKRTLLKN